MNITATNNRIAFNHGQKTILEACSLELSVLSQPGSLQSSYWWCLVGNSAVGASCSSAHSSSGTSMETAADGGKTFSA